MGQTGKLQVGTRVRIAPQHWLRDGEVGEVVRYERRGRNNWLVQFGNCCPGGGIDGDKLWLDQNEMSVLPDDRASVNDNECFGVARVAKGRSFPVGLQEYGLNNAE